MVALKNMRLAGERGQREDAFDVGDETHIEHPVCFVDDHDLNAGEQQLATLEVVQKAARRGDQHVDTAVDQGVLFLEADASDEQGLGQLHVLCVDIEILGHLSGEFPRRAEHEAARHARAGPATGQHGNHRQREACGFPGAGLRDAKDIATFQGGGWRLPEWAWVFRTRLRPRLSGPWD
jgi:hypothetical protein